VPLAELSAIWRHALTASELTEAISAYAPYADQDADDTIIIRASEKWRAAKERELRDQALRSAGFDPSNMDWKALEDPLDRSAVNGAEWRTFWQTTNVDLHLIAEDVPEALRLGVSIDNTVDGWWTDAQKDLVLPSDDDIQDKTLDCIVMDESMNWIPWFPHGDQMLVCRGFFREYSVDLPPDEEGFVDTDSVREEFEEDTPAQLQQIREKAKSYKNIVSPLTGRGAWDLMALPMNDWQNRHYSLGTNRHQDDLMPSLRPLFSAPNGWTPAPDGTIASAILRSLAYGEGDERLDMKMKKAVNDRVACLRQMKDHLSQAYNASLAEHGYGDE
jgi:hypothetical protein